jgi:hypothetical protein
VRNASNKLLIFGFEMNRASTAILFFSRSVGAEAKAKSWVKSKNGAQLNRKISQELIQSTLETLEASGLEVHYFDETLQQGRSFGERFSNAFSALFDLGYERVIALGNDTLELEQIQWSEILTALDEGKTVLGPNNRGGAYLIALSRSQFNKPQFEALPWQQSGLFEALMSAASSQHLLGTCLDLNLLSDLLLAYTTADVRSSLLFVLKALFGSKLKSLQARVPSMESAGNARMKVLRGPPALRA